MTMKTRKLICMILAVSMLCLVAACAGGEEAGDSPDPSPPTDSVSPESPGGGDVSIINPSPTNGGDKTDPPEPTGDGGDTAGPDASGTPEPTDGGGDTPSTETPSQTPSQTPDGGGDASPEPSAPPSGGGSSSTLSGSASDVLGMINDALASAGVEMPMSSPPMDVPVDLSESLIGLSESDFGSLVKSASRSMAMIGTFAHEIVVVQAKDARSATQVKDIAAGGGYDPKKWICVFPEKGIAVESGDYVLIVASYAEVADTAAKLFKEAGGGGGDVNVFWQFAG